MLSDPTKLRTRAGLGYLVGRRDVFSGLDARAASELAQRLLEEPGNEVALREALGLGADTDREMLADWLRTALAGGSTVCVRTKRAPPTMDEADATDLVDLVDPDKRDGASERATTWMELHIVDERGEPLPEIPVRIAAGDSRTISTDANGIARIDDAPTSFGRATLANSNALHESLRERWSQPQTDAWANFEQQPHVTVVPALEPLPEVALQAKVRHTLVFQPRVSRVRIVGSVFDTNKAFVLPDALPLLRDVVALYAQHPKAQMLVLGHTDTSGEPHINDPLSLQRAKAVVAYLCDDVDAWLAFFEQGIASSQRWCEREESFMLEHVLWARGEVPQGDPVRVFQRLRGLTVDGDVGQNTRRALVEDYMALDGSTLPGGVEAVAHGCGENFPLADDGTSLDLSPPDGVDDPTDRRVEVLFFDAPLGILPPPPQENSSAGGLHYLTWLQRSRFTQDMLVIRPLALAVRVVDEDSEVAVASAAVSLKGVDLLGNAPSGNTDTFGVRTFVNIVAGAYHVNVDKPGYEPGALTHVVVPGAPASVLVVRLALERTVNLQAALVGPAGERIPLPQGAHVSLNPDEGVSAEAETTENGQATLRAGATTGRASLALALGDKPCLVRAVDGAMRLASLDEALAASEQGSAFVQLPAALAPTHAQLRLDARLALDEGGSFDIETALQHSRDSALTLDIVPAWEHVAFTFFDRHHGRPRSVPGATADGQPSLVLTGHPAGADTPEAHTAWPIQAAGRTVHSLAWFPDPGHVALPEDTVRMRCPARTFVVSDRDDAKVVVLEVVPSSGPRAELVDAPNADRLLFYDLPAQWQGDRYFARRASEAPELKRLYGEVARQTSPHDPMLVSLDDIVLMRSDGAGGRQVVSVETHFTVLDNNMEVYKANHTVPKGYGEPYFTHNELLTPAPGVGGVPGYVLLDTADFTRAVVSQHIHDVFDLRTDTSDAVGPPVGARIAYTPFSGRSVKGAIEQHSAFFVVVGEFQVDGPGTPATEVARRGRSMMALFRCTDSRGPVEQAASLQILRLRFDFAPSSEPPAGASVLEEKETAVATKWGPVLAAQALDHAAQRWTGVSGSAPEKQLVEPKKGTLISSSYRVKSERARSLFGDTASVEVQHALLFLRWHEPPALPEGSKPNPFEFTVSLWSGVRSSMPRHGDADWDYIDTLTIDRARNVVAHELGHALGLPDEYAETKRHASWGRQAFSDNEVPEGRPYVFDEAWEEGSRDKNDIHVGVSPATSSMMTRNESARPRQFAPLALEIRKLASLPRLARVDVGALSYAPPLLGSPNPYFPSTRRLSVVSGEHGINDGFLYLYGPDTALSSRFADKSGPVDGQLVVRTKFCLVHPGSYLDVTRYLATLQGAINSAARHTARIVTLSVGGITVRARLVWSPRFLVQELPSATEIDEAEIRNEHLRSLRYRGEGGSIEVPVRDFDQEEADLQAQIERKQTVQAEAEQTIAKLEEKKTRTLIEDAVLEDNRERHARAIAEEAELLDEVATLREDALNGEESLKKDYEDFVTAIVSVHPPHVRLNATAKWGIKLSGGTSTTRTVTLPIKNERLTAARFAFRRVLMSLLGGSGHRTHLSTSEAVALARNLLQDAADITVLGASK